LVVVAVDGCGVSFIVWAFLQNLLSDFLPQAERTGKASRI
jgi:hypothetical protein